MVMRLQVITSLFPGGPAYNTFYSAGTTGADAELLSDNVNVLFNALDAYLANGTEVDFDGNVEEFDPTNGQTTGIFNVDTWHVDGTWGTNNAPAGTCLLLQWRTGIFENGREVRGRSYISGLGDLGDGAGGVPSAVVVAASSAANTYITQLESAVYSPTNGGLYSGISGACWSKFGLMRSRRD